MNGSLTEREVIESRIRNLELVTKLAPIFFLVMGVVYYIFFREGTQVIFTTSLTWDVTLFMLLLGLLIPQYLLTRWALRKSVVLNRKEIEGIQ